MSGGLLEARESSGSRPADSQSSGVDSERSGTNKIRCGELRKGPSESARGGGHPPDMAEYRVGLEGRGARAEGVGRKEGETVKTGKGPLDMRED